MKKITVYLGVILMMAVVMPTAQGGWNPFSGEDAEEKGVTSSETAKVIVRFKSRDPSMKVFFDKAYGYAIFPNVAKGGFGIGGAYGDGDVFEQGTVVGYTSITQLNVGLQLGGQTFSEIIFFKDKKTMTDFKSGNFEFGAQVSAVVVIAGISANVDYNDGVAIFTMPKGGFMYEASVGGQKFGFTPL